MTTNRAITAWQQYLLDTPWHWLSFEAWCHRNDVDIPQNEIDEIDGACQPCCNMTGREEMMQSIEDDGNAAYQQAVDEAQQ